MRICSGHHGVPTLPVDIFSSCCAYFDHDRDPNLLPGVKPFHYSVAVFRTVLRHQARYAAHADPAAFAVNKIALVLAWNGPLYPLYVVALVGRDALPWVLLTIPVSPVFYAIPWLSRISSSGARLALPLVGALNTIWCTKLFGTGSGVGLFLYPCILLPAFLHRRSERWLMLPLLGLMFALEFLPSALLGPPIMSLSLEASGRLAGLNGGSVAALLAFLVFQIVDVIRVGAKNGPDAAI